ncbi:adenosine receptor A2a-like [Oculina patagonica]
MAAIAGHFNFWNMTSEEAFNKVWLRVDNVKAVYTTLAVITMIMSPIIVFGNSLVILSVWKDPLKNLRSSPSNFILLSMAVADLLVGLVVCPLTAHWGWAISRHKDTSFSLLFAVVSFLLNVSVSHMFLLTVDRFFALVTPLQYRAKVTNKRVSIATVTCWIYFLLFGCVLGLLQEYYAIVGTIYNLQILCFLVSMMVLYVVILWRFHRHSKMVELKEQPKANRQMILQRERRLWKAITTVICAFLVCFMPWFIIQITLYVCLPCHRNLSFLMMSFVCATGLTYANSALNPFLYAWRIPKYRDTFKYFLKKRAYCCNDQNRQPVDVGSDAYVETRL